ncbi:hypothetical protein C8Q77DRAFT_1114843 [Trametes polyzona]|nr:hypothetical protein C8Q77DRAFT_1114843 [Trametes polyzona]
MTSVAHSTRPDRYRISFILTPKAGLSLEEFNNYWVEHHIPLLLSLPIVKKNLIKYERFHIDTPTTTSLSQHFTGEAPAPFGGVAIFESDTLEKLLEIFEDEEYKRLILPDAEVFVDSSKAQILAGHYTTVTDA